MRYTKHIVREMHSYLETKSYKLSAHQQKRINGHSVIALVNNLWFHLLRGTKPSESQKRSEVYIGALAPVVDDMQDEMGYSFADILAICTEKKKPKEQVEYLLHFIWSQLIESSTNKEELLNLFVEVGKSQEDSTKQIGGRLELAALYAITEKKGADATYFFQAIQGVKSNAQEKEAIMFLGATLQYVNDLFDVYKDNRDNIQTPMLEMSDVEAYNLLLEKRFLKLMNTFAALNYPQKHRRKLQISVMAVLSRATICADQLIKLQRSNNGTFDVNAFKRDDLVCDMDKPINIFRNIYQTSRYKYV